MAFFKCCSPFFVYMDMKNKIISNYLLSFDRMNTLISFRIREVADEDEKKKIQIITDDLLSFLILAYRDGIQAVAEMLNTDISVDTNSMRNAVYKKIDGENFTDRVRKHIVAGHNGKLLDMAESEYHRIFNTAIDDGANQSDIPYDKTWYTVGDDKVRDTHFYLGNMTVHGDERFFTYDGDSALFPGGFDRAENNANCRCIVLYTRQRSR